MAVVQTHCFNWMDHDGTRSETLNLALLRHSDTGNLRYSDYRQRQEVVADISMRLKIIKRELGLLPPEEEVEWNENKGQPEDLYVRLDDEESEVFLQIQERRKRLFALMERPIEGTDESDVYYYPGTPADEMQREAAAPFALFVQSLLVQFGETFVSYLDGSEFLTLSKLVQHNEARRGEVEAAAEEAGVLLPSESEFDVTSLHAALENREQARMKLDAVRAASDPSYAAKFVRAEERDNSGQPITNVSPEDGTEAQLSAKLTAAKAQLESVRMAYNRRAHASARRVQKALANRVPPAEL
ncbi:hypothetical protein TcCL_NonESM01630 [Trypanosoma cruzi]|nr:hypothetical protein TcCL_NonESM01630 [Trypanosoma cruzi]